MKNISPKGIIIGSLTDVVATYLLLIPLIVYFVFSRNLYTLPEGELEKAIKDILYNDSYYYYLSLLIGALGSVLGGYLAARIAGRGELLNGALASFLCVALGIHALLSGSELPHPIWAQHLLLAESVGLSLFGGYLRFMQVNKNS